MSAAGIQFDVTDSVSPFFSAIAAGLGDSRGMHEFIGREILGMVHDYLQQLSRSKHTTAENLGATPSGFLGRIADGLHVTADSQAAVLGIPSPGAGDGAMGRAFHDVTIHPTGGRKFITIPLIAEAYNQRAYRVQGLVPIVTGTGDSAKGVLMMPGPGSSRTYEGRRYSGPDKFKRTTVTGGSVGTAWYLLVAVVHQKQDRSLLPSDAAFEQAAKLGVDHYLDYLELRKAGGPN